MIKIQINSSQIRVCLIKSRGGRKCSTVLEVAGLERSRKAAEEADIDTVSGGSTTPARDISVFNSSEPSSPLLADSAGQIGKGIYSSHEPGDRNQIWAIATSK
ncbi:unnamed protein product [Linum trigynum]|uniref:Uncharacterized protein n=1 Tax=Linum trigynum TaxID=586398 RepID=A0AAV2G8I4_9ROSI